MRGAERHMYCSLSEAKVLLLLFFETGWREPGWQKRDYRMMQQPGFAPHLTGLSCSLVSLKAR